MSVIIVSGTPGTGKTKLAKALSKDLGFEYVDVNKLIAENKLFDEYDEKRKCKIVDVKKLNDFLIKKIIKKNKKSLILDSHLAHFLPKKYVNVCIITRCDLKTLKSRLQKRSYSKEKICENLDSEIFDVCLEEARQKAHEIILVDASVRISKTRLRKIKNELKAFIPGSL